MEDLASETPLESVPMVTDDDVTHSLYDITARTATFLVSYFLYLLIMCIVLDFWDKLKEPTKQWVRSKIVKYVDRRTLAEYLRGIARSDIDKPRKVLRHSPIFMAENYESDVGERKTEEAALQDDTTPTSESFTPVSDHTVTPVSEPADTPSSAEPDVFQEDLHQEKVESEDIREQDHDTPPLIEQGHFDDVEKMFVDNQFSDDEDKIDMEDFEHISDADDEGEGFGMKDPFKEMEEPELLSIDDFEPSEQLEKMTGPSEDIGLESEIKGQLSAEVESLSEDRMQSNEELEHVSGQMSQFIADNKPNVVTEAEVVGGGDLLQWDVTEVKENPDLSPEAMSSTSPEFLIGDDESPEGVTPTPDAIESPIFEPLEEPKEVIEEESPTENIEADEQVDLLGLEDVTLTEDVQSSVEPCLVDDLLAGQDYIGESLISVDDPFPESEAFEPAEVCEPTQPLLQADVLKPTETSEETEVTEPPALFEREKTPTEGPLESLEGPDQSVDLLGLNDLAPEQQVNESFSEYVSDNLTADLLMLGSDEPASLVGQANEQTAPLIEIGEFSQQEEGLVGSLETDPSPAPVSTTDPVSTTAPDSTTDLASNESLYNSVDTFVQETITKAVEQYQSEEELRSASLD